MARKQLLALTTIMLTVEPGKPGNRAEGVMPTRPKTKTIPMNSRFKAMDADQEKELIDMKAAREMTKEEIGAAEENTNRLIDASDEAGAAATQTEEKSLATARAPNARMKPGKVQDQIAEKLEADGSATGDGSDETLDIV